MSTIIHENQRGFLFYNGKFVKILEAGKYLAFYGRKIVIAELDQPIHSELCSLDVLQKDKKAASQITIVDIADEQLALHFINGKFAECLKHGRYAFWSVYDQHEFKIINISDPEVSKEIPEYIFHSIPSSLFTRIEVSQFQKARLYYNNKLVKLLDSGTYYFWKNKIQIDVSYADTRLTQMDITGQEILTQDKVSLRINFVCSYRITDYIKVITEIDNYTEQMHVAAQLALRDYVGKYRIDEILENKDQISSYVFERLKEKEKDFYVKIVDAGVKDIILPGEIRDIMNTVLIAEKRAQANVITRREEVASTRSLLNTAKLMDENQTLYKLKGLEYLERICENVGSIHVNGNGDILSQLASLIHLN